MNKKKLGFIGGSGLYEIDFIKNKKFINKKSSWGNPSSKIIQGTLSGNEIYFLPRHGLGHKISPSSINYRANIDCLKQCGVTDVISLSAVGSLKKSLSPGTFVIVDQFVDRTVNRENSFFNDGIVVHVPLSKPTSTELMLIAKKSLNKLKIKYNYGGTYIAIEGPQFSTKSESKLYKSWGCDIIGMTNMPEAKLCREAEIRYASISMVTDYDSWLENDNVDLNLIIKTLNKNSQKSKKFMKEFSLNYFKSNNFTKDTTSTILDTSIITNKKYWKKSSEIKLKNILKRFNKAKSKSKSKSKSK